MDSAFIASISEEIVMEEVEEVYAEGGYAITPEFMESYEDKLCAYCANSDANFLCENLNMKRFWDESGYIVEECDKFLLDMCVLNEAACDGVLTGPFDPDIANKVFTAIFLGTEQDIPDLLPEQITCNTKETDKKEHDISISDVEGVEVVSLGNTTDTAKDTKSVWSTKHSALVKSGRGSEVISETEIDF